MKKKILLQHIAKIFEKKNVSENDTFVNLDFDSLIGLDLTTFNDEHFSDLKIDYEHFKNFRAHEKLKKIVLTVIA